MKKYRDLRAIDLMLELDDGTKERIKDTGYKTLDENNDYIYSTEDGARYIVPEYFGGELVGGYSVVARSIGNENELYYLSIAEGDKKNNN